ncbi:hypothetical protein ACFSSA_08700 [Luteolibacter algae]|uniref:Peptidase n=1 Tax=Luteolibacter algae TaxID=454151 RepID=A0ABW5D6L8_9BACT
MKIPASKTGIELRILMAVLCGSSISFALEPVSPPGGQRGTDVTITLNDPNIASFQELITYQPGLSLSNLTLDEKNKKIAKATLHVSPDAAFGEHSLRIRTAYDISYLRSFWVGPFPSIQEIEPNNSPAEAQRIELNSTVQGIIKTEDQDSYIVTLKKGQRLSAEVEAMRLGRILFDAHLSILAPDGRELAAADDTTLLKTDPLLSVIVPEDGDYGIIIREAAYEGNNNCAYRLHIGTFPRPTSVFPLGGKPGETIDFKFIGDPTGAFTQTVTLPQETDEAFPLYPVLNDETAPSANPVLISTLEHITQDNTNFSQQKACPFPPIPSAVDGILNGNVKHRWFKFRARKGQNLDIKVLARSHRSPLDPVLAIRDARNHLASNDDDQNFPDSLIKWTCPADGEYFLLLRDQLERTGEDFVFRIQIAERKPLIAASLPVTQRNNSQKDKVFAVPRGNRYAALIQLKRENMNCGFSFLTGNLPGGIKMIIPPIPKSLNKFPVIFEAEKDAPLGSSLQKFTLRPTGENVPDHLTASLSDTVHHIEINNEGTYHSFSTEVVPLAVTEPTPFSIEIDKPTKPIVKNGKLMIRVRAHREDGYKGKIITKLPWSPAGISGPASLDIPPDKTEAEYELNANTDAAIGTWPICITAEADTTHGRRTVSSGFVDLDITEPFLALTLDMASGQIGRNSAVLAKIEHFKKFEGQATAELVSLPHGVTSTPVSFTGKDEEIIFPLTISAEAKPGKSTGLFCKVLIPLNHQPVIHQTGQGGVLRIDPASEQQPEHSQTNEKPDQTIESKTKPLSRLEQLRMKK